MYVSKFLRAVVSVVSVSSHVTTLSSPNSPCPFYLLSTSPPLLPYPLFFPLSPPLHELLNLIQDF